MRMYCAGIKCSIPRMRGFDSDFGAALDRAAERDGLFGHIVDHLVMVELDARLHHRGDDAGPGIAKPGALQGPWKSENAVYVYQVINQEKAERKPAKEELDKRYSQTRGAQVFAAPRTISNILYKANKVEKHLIDFY